MDIVAKKHFTNDLVTLWVRLIHKKLFCPAYSTILYDISL